MRTRNHPDYTYSNTNCNSSCMKTTHLRPVPLGVLMTQHLGLNICTHAVLLIVQGIKSQSSAWSMQLAKAQRCLQYLSVYSRLMDVAFPGVLLLVPLSSLSLSPVVCRGFSVSPISESFAIVWEYQVPFNLERDSTILANRGIFVLPYLHLGHLDLRSCDALWMYCTSGLCYGGWCGCICSLVDGETLMTGHQDSPSL